MVIPAGRSLLSPHTLLAHERHLRSELDPFWIGGGTVARMISFRTHADNVSVPSGDIQPTARRPRIHKYLRGCFWHAGCIRCKGRTQRADAEPGPSTGRQFVVQCILDAPTAQRMRWPAP